MLINFRQANESKYEENANKYELLETQVAEAKKIAENSEQKCEEIVRKLVVAEKQKERTEKRAERSEEKMKGLEEELSAKTTNVKSLSVIGDKSVDKEYENEDKIRELKQR